MICSELRTKNRGPKVSESPTVIAILAQYGTDLFGSVTAPSVPDRQRSKNPTGGHIQSNSPNPDLKNTVSEILAETHQESIETVLDTVHAAADVLVLSIVDEERRSERCARAAICSEEIVDLKSPRRLRH